MANTNDTMYDMFGTDDENETLCTYESNNASSMNLNSENLYEDDTRNSQEEMVQEDSEEEIIREGSQDEMVREGSVDDMIREGLLHVPVHRRLRPLRNELLLPCGDVVAKAIAAAALVLWAKFSKNNIFAWVITSFSMSSFDNTLVVGVPLLKAIHGR